MKARTLTGLCLVAVAVLGGWISLVWISPPLRMTLRNNEVAIDVQALGEYQTTINRIRVTDITSGNVMWEVAAQNGEAQIHGFSLRGGANPAGVQADFGEYHVVGPVDGRQFQLQTGRAYRLDVWGGNEYERKSADFLFKGDIQSKSAVSTFRLPCLCPLASISAD